MQMSEGQYWSMIELRKKIDCGDVQSLKTAAMGPGFFIYETLIEETKFYVGVIVSPDRSFYKCVYDHPDQNEVERFLNNHVFYDRFA